jgi:hypothetical protein
MEKEDDMQNALRTEVPGAPSAGRRAAGAAAWFETRQFAEASDQRWRAFALPVVAYFNTISENKKRRWS